MPHETSGAADSLSLLRQEGHAEKDVRRTPEVDMSTSHPPCLNNFIGHKSILEADKKDF